MIRPQASGESPNPIIQGFTIKNGKGTLLKEELDFDGGTVQTNKFGGGLLVFNSSATITHNIFQNNGNGNDDMNVEMGGGVFAYNGDGMDFEDFILSHSSNQNYRNTINFIENLFEGNYANIGKTISSKTDLDSELNLIFTGCVFDYAFDDGANGKVSDYWCKSDGNSAIQFNSISGLSNSVSTDLYVSNDGLESNDGSQNSPLGTIKSAMERVYVPEGENLIINLESGTYLGNRSSGFPLQALNRVIVKGSNDIDENPTILDGSENTCLIKAESVIGFKLESAILLNGNASPLSEGGGSVNIKNSTIEFENVHVKESQSSDRGGAVFGLNSEIEIKDSYLSRNSSEDGGAIYLTSSSLMMQNSYIEESEAEDGGALFIENNSNITIDNSEIEVGLVEHNGGAIYADNSIINLTNGTEIKESTSFNFGGGLYLKNSELNSENSEIKENVSSNDGSAIYAEDAIINLNNSAVNENFCDEKGGGIYFKDTEGIIQNTEFNVNIAADAAGAIYLENSNVQIINSSFVENETDEHGGSLNIEGGFVTIENSLFLDNESNEYGGAITIEEDSYVLIKSTKLLNNRTGSGGQGGAITVKGANFYNTTLRIEKSTIAFNSARSKGGGIFSDGARIELINSNIFDNGINSFDEEGGGLYLSDDTEIYIVNSNIWDNEPDQILTSEDDVEIFIAYSNIMDNEYGLQIEEDELILGDGLLNVNPLFEDPDEINFQLNENSPVIDMGIDFLIFDYDTLINFSEEQYFGNAPDIGAVEYGFLSTNPDELFPNKIKISEAYPNPFNPTTEFDIYSPTRTKVNISVYNVQGKIVYELSDKALIQGWNKIDFQFATFPTGLYLIYFDHPNETIIKKITLIK